MVHLKLAVGYGLSLLAEIFTGKCAASDDAMPQGWPVMEGIMRL